MTSADCAWQIEVDGKCPELPKVVRHLTASTKGRYRCLDCDSAKRINDTLFEVVSYHNVLSLHLPNFGVAWTVNIESLVSLSIGPCTLLDFDFSDFCATLSMMQSLTLVHIHHRSSESGTECVGWMSSLESSLKQKTLQELCLGIEGLVKTDSDVLALSRILQSPKLIGLKRLGLCINTEVMRLLSVLSKLESRLTELYLWGCFTNHRDISASLTQLFTLQSGIDKLTVKTGKYYSDPWKSNDLLVQEIVKVLAEHKMNLSYLCLNFDDPELCKCLDNPRRGVCNEDLVQFFEKSPNSLEILDLRRSKMYKHHWVHLCKRLNVVLATRTKPLTILYNARGSDKMHQAIQLLNENPRIFCDDHGPFQDGVQKQQQQQSKLQKLKSWRLHWICLCISIGFLRVHQSHYFRDSIFSLLPTICSMDSVMTCSISRSWCEKVTRTVFGKTHLSNHNNENKNKRKFIG
jgi:hypothetical protein